MENSKKKLRLDELQVESFVTGNKDKSQTIQGGYTMTPAQRIADAISPYVSEPASADFGVCYSKDPGPFTC